ncbi:MAG TPA: response regulator transcription factor [Saprospiraceae bacterium]|nr:response regulator transcription factor [Saprospiraceae bacterium]HMQ84322.1 response regulator transcription factor [Saprospiraceae bacterium]
MIKTLIADDHKMFREGLRAILEQESDIEVVGEAGSAREIFDLISKNQPDIVLLDITLGEENGVEIAKILREKYPKLRILVVTMHTESSYILKMLEIGAAGYILKDAGKVEVLNAIRSVSAGDSYFSQQASAIIIAFLQNKLSPAVKRKDSVLLTRREIEVLKLIAGEYTNQEIADKLFISPRTVDTHRRNLLEKLRLKNTASLVKYAIQHGYME